ncbi:MAG TPA: orc1/cdc6 family replication initiation protein [Sulfolobales archaeon]|nr:orc1/cdc6 family replication initiation protein [Sulfolobales archaeon]
MNKEVLRPDYIPESLPHREGEIEKVAQVLGSSLQGMRPSNLFIYGLTGTGKTAVAKFVLKRLGIKGSERGVRIYWVYVNTRIENTSYRVLSRVGEHLGVRVPFTGLSTAEVYRRVMSAMDSRSSLIIIVMDEIDYMVKREGDEILYRLTRANEELSSSRLSIVGITNDIKFVETLDARVRSSLGEEEIIFPPYNAQQLRDILMERARIAFRPGAVGEDVISLCAALAAREHGDARRALDLLRVAGEIADREGSDKVLEDHVYRARNEIERDRASEIILTLPIHGKLILYSIVKILEEGREATTGEIYLTYREIARKQGLEPITQRRASDIISELDMVGIISAITVNRGRYGKTRIIKLQVSPEIVLEALKADGVFSF